MCARTCRGVYHVHVICVSVHPMPPYSTIQLVVRLAKAKFYTLPNYISNAAPTLQSHVCNVSLGRGDELGSGLELEASSSAVWRETPVMEAKGATRGGSVARMSRGRFPSTPALDAMPPLRGEGRDYNVFSGAAVGYDGGHGYVNLYYVDH